MRAFSNARDVFPSLAVAAPIVTLISCEIGLAWGKSSAARCAIMALLASKLSKEPALTEASKAEELNTDSAVGHASTQPATEAAGSYCLRGLPPYQTSPPRSCC